MECVMCLVKRLTENGHIQREMRGQTLTVATVNHHTDGVYDCARIDLLYLTALVYASPEVT